MPPTLRRRRATAAAGDGRRSTGGKRSLRPGMFQPDPAMAARRGRGATEVGRPAGTRRLPDGGDAGRRQPGRMARRPRRRGSRRWWPSPADGGSAAPHRALGCRNGGGSPCRRACLPAHVAAHRCCPARPGSSSAHGWPAAPRTAPVRGRWRQPGRLRGGLWPHPSPGPVGRVRHRHRYRHRQDPGGGLPHQRLGSRLLEAVADRAGRGARRRMDGASARRLHNGTHPSAGAGAAGAAVAGGRRPPGGYRDRARTVGPAGR